MRVLLISLYLCLVPGLLLANTHSVQFTESEKALLQMTPEELLNVKLSPQSVQQYWEDHGVTSVSKKGEDPFDTPSAVYVISQEDIQRSGMTSIPELLRMVPGLQVAQVDSHSWAISSRGFNRQYSSRLRVLIDGRAVIYPLFSGVFWEEQDLILADIDRIEVIRGPGATTWGENAITGVINIITKHARDTQGTYTSLTYGTHDKYIAEARYGGQIDDATFYQSYVKHSKRGNSKAVIHQGLKHDDWSLSKAGFRIDHQQNLHDISLHGSVMHNHDNQYFSYVPVLEAPFEEASRMDKESDNANLLLSWKYANGDVSNHLQSYVDYYAGTLSGDNENSDFEFATYDAEFQQIRFWDTNNEFTWGVGYRFYRDTLNGLDQLQYTPEQFSGSHYNGFLQNKTALLDDVLFLTLGSKIEHHYFSGLEFQPSVRVAWYPTDTQTVWASIARATRVPTRFEERAEQRLRGTPSGFLGVVSDSSFDSEKSLSYELGYRVKPRNGLLIDGTVFYTSYRDLRSYTPTSAFADDIALPYLITNSARADSYGFELSTHWQILPYWRIEGAYSFFDIDFEVPADNLFADGLGNPEHQLNVRSQFDLSHNVFLDLNLYTVGALEAYEFQSEEIPDYYRFDIRLAWQPISSVEWSVVGQNLLDEHHQEFSDRFLSHAGEIRRSFYTKLSWEF